MARLQGAHDLGLPVRRKLEWQEADAFLPSVLLSIFCGEAFRSGLLDCSGWILTTSS